MLIKMLIRKIRLPEVELNPFANRTTATMDREEAKS